MKTDLFNDWLCRLGDAWIARDPDAAANLCSEDVTYYEDPFMPPLRGRAAVKEVWLEVPKAQKDIKFKFETITVTDNVGVGRWWASFTRLPSEKKAELDGIYVVTLDEAGLCTEFHQWWNSKAN